MKKTNLTKYLLAYVGLAGFSVAVEASVVTVTASTPGSWNYETAGYGTSPGSYVANPRSTIPIVASPAAPGTGGSVQLISTAGGTTAAAQISTTAYDGQLLSSISTLGYQAYSVQNNGSQFPYMQINVALNVGGTAGAGGEDTLFFEPPYQTASSGNSSLPSQGVTIMSQWQTWNALEGGWWDNGNFSPGTGVNSLAAFLALFPDATIADNPFTAGDGGISLTVGWDGSVNEGYVNNITINSTTYDFEPAPAVPEPTTIIAGASMLLPFGASALRLLRKRQIA